MVKIPSAREPGFAIVKSGSELFGKGFGKVEFLAIYG
jgi:hypothetical protein